MPSAPQRAAADEAPAPGGPTAFPIRVSPDGRHFVAPNGQAVFWLGTTQWELFRQYTLDEAKTILEASRRHGFVFLQVMLMGVGDGTAPNVQGHKPWLNDDPLAPNEAYFANVDAVVEAAGRSGLAISMTLYHQRWRQRITPEKARAWAAWLARRYADAGNIVWSMTPEARPEYVPVLQELAAGLREGDGGCHLISVHPDPSPFSSSLVHTEGWLDFNSIQTWKDVNLIYPFVTHDHDLKPTKPVLMAEGAYEAGTEYGFDVTPLWVRRQAYYSYLAGGSHTYGHNDSWRVLPTWRQALNAPGAEQMGILKGIFLERKEWWRLVPDQSIFASGGNTSGDVLHLAARHSDGRWLMVYLADPAAFSISMSKLAAARAKALWIDPRTGSSRSAGAPAATGDKAFETPPGWEDALLVLEAIEA